MGVNDGSRAGETPSGLHRRRRLQLLRRRPRSRERERVLDRQRFGRVWGRRLPSHQDQLFSCMYVHVHTKGKILLPHLTAAPARDGTYRDRSMIPDGAAEARRSTTLTCLLWTPDIRQGRGG
jgi:hypothetical protein